jgi:hypothetical protein
VQAAVDTPPLQQPGVAPQTPAVTARRVQVEVDSEVDSDAEDDRDPISQLADRLRSLQREHPCCIRPPGCQCDGKEQLKQLQADMALHGVNLHQVQAILQANIDSAWCELFLLGNGGQGFSRQDILTNLRLL